MSEDTDLGEIIKERDWLRHCLHVIGRQDPPVFLNDAVRGALNDCIQNPPPSPELAEAERAVEDQEAYEWWRSQQ